MAGRVVRVNVLVLVLVAVYLASVSSRQTSQNEGCQGDTVSSLIQSAGCSPACLSSAFSLCSLAQEQNQLSTLTEEIRNMMMEMRSTPGVTRPGQVEENSGTSWRWRPRNCKDLRQEGDIGQGVRMVFPYDNLPLKGLQVYCDQESDGGGWTVILRRTNSSAIRENFYRTWVEYEEGFGNITSEFWIGLRNLNVLSSSINQECKVDLTCFEGNKRWAKYSTFRVGPSYDQYRLFIDGYTGTAGDALTYNNNCKFSTFDADHDNSDSIHCAQERSGAMWHNNNCTYANPNGYQYEGSGSPRYKGIVWYQWRGFTYSMKEFTWMIRPVN
ncbi:hypothetical protein Pcinc_026413 [Petrolisthes cinctipes]|uniref:Fibrinogen C-terminal domain-containing protein n=1 Tax=Petrolisthes cinctipes TaxID=88211 RepID=A0AAE1KBP5_PETCI|nr:hypothetical protein Pcinc_026413 [Petrolisthes cinctipes]